MSDATTSPAPDGSAEQDEALRRECLRVYRRYAVEIVEALDFCPYAARCRGEGRTREIVLTSPELSLDASLEAVDSVARDEMIEVALILLPRVDVPRLAFARFVETLRAAHQRSEGGLVMAMEGFHPDAEADLRAPERLVPFVRRTPDPTIQLVRHRVLERMRRAAPSGTAFFDPATTNLEDLLRAPAAVPLHERIARTNHETVTRLGEADVRARLDDILEDRDRAYAALGVPPRIAFSR